MTFTRSQPGSPLPQARPVSDASPVRVTQGFFASLPPNAISFFSRQYLSDYPRPIQVGQGPAYPRRVSIAEIVVPENNAIVIRDGVFKAYQQNGLDVNDMVPVDDRRLATYIAFGFNISDKGQIDFQTNLYGPGGLLARQAAGGNTALAPGAQVPATAKPYGGSIITGPAEQWALYAQPQQKIQASAWIVRPPPFEIRRFSFDLSGFILSKTGFEQIKIGFLY